MTSASNSGKPSESSGHPTPPPVEQAQTSPTEGLAKAWGAVNKDLKQALESWEALNEQMVEKQSPETEQLSEVKKLLGELKQKLKQFSE